MSNASANDFVVLRGGPTLPKAVGCWPCRWSNAAALFTWTARNSSSDRGGFSQTKTASPFDAGVCTFLRSRIDQADSDGAVMATATGSNPFRRFCTSPAATARLGPWSLRCACTCGRYASRPDGRSQSSGVVRPPARWRRLRRQVLTEHPWCECDECQGQVYYPPASVVHHRQPHGGDERVLRSRQPASAREAVSRPTDEQCKPLHINRMGGGPLNV